MKVDKIINHADFMDRMDFCKAHIDYVQTRLNAEDKNEAVLDLLERRSYRQVLQFAHILNKTGQERIAQLIECKHSIQSKTLFKLFHRNLSPTRQQYYRQLKVRMENCRM